MMFEEFREHGLTDVELQQWLEAHGIDPPSMRGHGHVVSDELTSAMYDEFVVIPIATISRLLGDQ